MKRAILTCLLLSGALTLPGIAAAQRLQIQAAALAGTGVSLGMGAGTTVARRSPTSVAVQVSGSNSERPWLRFGGTIRGEVEGKVTLGLVPQLSLLRSFSRLWLEGVLGVPLVIAPKGLYGIEVGGGVGFQLVEWVSVVGRLFVSFYFLGNDLPEDSFLLMVQAYAGFEFHF